ncbi:MAG TPA: hypothetical protein VNQ90_00600 [Chthoniobacteraceae bacterium]|nr:hypothetical protein [Chthoniobacteraceae bacterium]
MFRRFALPIHLAIVLMLFAGSGAQWLLLQSVAWTSMLVNFSQQTSLVEAIEKTFDGSSPCSLCDHIAKAKKSPGTGNASMQETGQSLRGVLTATLPTLIPSSAPYRYPALSAEATRRADRPTTPPPRAGLRSA